MTALTVGNKFPAHEKSSGGRLFHNRRFRSDVDLQLPYADREGVVRRKRGESGGIPFPHREREVVHGRTARLTRALSEIMVLSFRCQRVPDI